MESTRSRIPCPINFLVIKDSIESPPLFILKKEYFVEKNLIEQFRHVVVKEKHKFYSKGLKTDVSIADESFPLDISLFNEELHIVIYLLS